MGKNGSYEPKLGENGWIWPEIWGKWMDMAQNLGKMGKCEPKFGENGWIWPEIWVKWVKFGEKREL